MRRIIRLTADYYTFIISYHEMTPHLYGTGVPSEFSSKPLACKRTSSKSGPPIVCCHTIIRKLLSFCYPKSVFNKDPSNVSKYQSKQDHSMGKGAFFYSKQNRDSSKRSLVFPITEILVQHKPTRVYPRLSRTPRSPNLSMPHPSQCTYSYLPTPSGVRKSKIIRTCFQSDRRAGSI